MIRVGVDYYPEHWGKSLWEKDIMEMASAGVNTVRIAEFSWSLLEPKEGEFDFSWLDEVIELLARYDIDIILCTPTNCAPLWMYKNYPDTLQTGRNGHPTEPGIRGHRCMTSLTFRRFAERIIEKMTDRYIDHPRVIAWQLDNEPEGNHCCCPSCAEGFRELLKTKYTTLQELNRRWGTDVWSGTYSSWEQIFPPMGTDYQYGWLNPSCLLEYERWAAESCTEYLCFQANLIRREKTDAVITTNAYGSPGAPDFHQIFEHTDIASFDNYPEVRIPDDPEKIYSQAFALDMTRGYKKKSFWILEQLSGPKGCWMPMSPTTLPGMINGYAWQAVARGADAVIFFRWRSAARGAEMFWHGLFDGEKPEGRRYEEFKAFLREAGERSEISSTTVRSKVAVLHSYDQNRAFHIQTQSEGFSYAEQLRLIHDGFITLGVNADIISTEDSFEGYRVLAAPALFIADPSLVRRLEDFVRVGGTLLLGNRSGVKDADNARVLEPLPGAFRELTGCRVLEYDPIGEKKQHIETETGETFTVTSWCDILEPNGATTVARYRDSFYAGRPAITRNRFGEGVCYYIGTVGERSLYRILAKSILDQAGILTVDLPVGVEVSVRENDYIIYTFLFNNSDKIKRFKYNDEKITMEPFEMKIFRRQKHDR